MYRRDNYQRKEFRYHNHNQNHQQRHYPLNTKWTIYAHDKEDTDWTDDSYKKCYEFDTIEKFWIFFKNFDDFSRHQFYIMRNKIEPRFECKENKNGGACSFIIQNIFDIKDTLIRVIIRTISEQIIDVKDYNQVTGISLNPKSDSATIKIWFRDYGWLKQNSENMYLNDIRTLTSKRLMKHKIT